MNDLQLSLLPLGLFIIVIMLIHNWIQLRKNKKSPKSAEEGVSRIAEVKDKNFFNSASRLRFWITYCFLLALVQDNMTAEVSIMYKSIEGMGLTMFIIIINIITWVARARDSGINLLWVIAMFIPLLNFIAVYLLGVTPSKDMKKTVNLQDVEKMEDKLQKALIWIRNLAYIVLGMILLFEYIDDNIPPEDLGVVAFIVGSWVLGISIVHFILSKICYLALSVPKSKRFKDEKIYSQVLSEIESNDYRKGLLAKALSEANGNEEKSRAIYIKLRYQSIKDEE